MPTQSSNMLRTGFLTIVTLAAFVLAFNIIMDPYLRIGAPRVRGFNARKSASDVQERFIKVHDVLRAEPTTLITGSSPSDEGIDPLDPTWPAELRPVYNLSFAESTPYIWLRYIQHTMAHRAISLVVIGLPSDAFITGVYEERQTEPEFERRLAVTADGAFNPEESRQNSWDLAQSVMSLDALTDSFLTLIGNIDGDSFNLVAGRKELRSDARKAMGTYRAFTLSNLFAVLSYRDMRRTQYANAMSDLRAILELCRARGTHVMLLVNPVHASRLELLDQLGYWTAYENWKRDLVALAERYSGGGLKQTQLWDFSGYDSYSTESVPPDGHEMRWYDDSDHYNIALGHMEISRLFGSGDPNFGTLLTNENIESHLMAIRAQQRQYHAKHPADVRATRYLFDSAMHMPVYMTARAE